jgi:hypothetical protein
VRSSESKAFDLWSKYFASIFDSRGSGIGRSEDRNKDSRESGGENRGEGNRVIINIVFRLLFRCFSTYSIARSLLAVLA